MKYEVCHEREEELWAVSNHHFVIIRYSRTSALPDMYGTLAKFAGDYVIRTGALPDMGH